MSRCLDLLRDANVSKGLFVLSVRSRANGTFFRCWGKVCVVDVEEWDSYVELFIVWVEVDSMPLSKV